MHLHDEPIQRLTSLYWKSATLGLPESISAEILEITDEMRQFSGMLRPGILENLGLVRAVEWLTSETGARTECGASFQSGDIDRDEHFAPELELALYRIAQEALTNCQKHAQCKAVWTSVWKDGDSVGLMVADDGVGISEAPNRTDAEHFGILGMWERAEQLGGTLSVTRRNPSGTVVTARIPLTATNKQAPQEELGDV